MIAVAEEVAEGFWVIEAYHVGAASPVVSAENVVIAIAVP